jgi:hypothetical protein
MNAYHCPLSEKWKWLESISNTDDWRWLRDSTPTPTGFTSICKPLFFLPTFLSVPIHALTCAHESAHIKCARTHTLSLSHPHTHTSLPPSPSFLRSKSSNKASSHKEYKLTPVLRIVATPRQWWQTSTSVENSESQFRLVYANNFYDFQVSEGMSLRVGGWIIVLLVTKKSEECVCAYEVKNQSMFPLLYSFTIATKIRLAPLFSFFCQSPFLISSY